MELLITGAFSCDNAQLVSIREIGYNITIHKDEKMIVDNPALYDAVICNGLFLYNNIEKFINLKLIQLTSVGLDRVPLDYINKKDIKIFNAKNAYHIPMAEWAVLKILEIYKNTLFFNKSQEIKCWNKNRNLLELSNKTVSILGFGAVGQEVAKRLKAFDVKIIGLDVINIKSNYLDEFYSIKDLYKALPLSDVVVLTLPLTSETKYLFNKNTFDLMKDNSVLINISRGAIINETDLINALKTNKLLGVASDVFEVEPLPSNSELWDCDNIIITPHNSFVSDGINFRLFNCIYNNLKCFL